MEEQLVSQGKLIIVAVLELAGSGHFLYHYADFVEDLGGAILDFRSLLCLLYSLEVNYDAILESNCLVCFHLLQHREIYCCLVSDASQQI